MLTTREAKAIISAAETKAGEINVPVIIAVLDAGAHLSQVIVFFDASGTARDGKLYANT